MSNIIIGVDPDSKAHGVAIYGLGGKLSSIQCMPLMSIMLLLARWADDGMSFDIVEVHMEDVCANNSVFMKQGRAGKKREGEAKARGRTLGMCQQSQIELERLFEYYKIKVVKHKISKMWKNDKAQFEKVTGWSGRSNEDTRSAAYFGWLGCKVK